MKKPLIVLLIVCVFVAGFVLGDRSWERMRLFRPVVVTPQTLMPDHLSHFLLAEIPPFSSDHYYFREGFTDVNEYWSFCLPPEQVKSFLSSYTERAKLPLAEDSNEIPDFVLGPKGQSEWDNRYWFRDFGQLDQVYYKRFLFCGYSADRNRLYLMNWNE
jgi:hypothetical protein